MDRLQLTFQLLEASDKKSNILCITEIKTQEVKTYILPAEYMLVRYHTKLTETDIFKRVKNCLEKRNQYRKILIKLTAELKNIYLDESNNLQFKDYLSEEYVQTSSVISTFKVVGITEEGLKKILE